MQVAEVRELREKIYNAVKKAVTKYFQFGEVDSNTKISIGLEVPVIKIPFFKKVLSGSLHGQEGAKTADAFFRDFDQKFQNGQNLYVMMKTICRLLATETIHKKMIKNTTFLEGELSNVTWEEQPMNADVTYRKKKAHDLIYRVGINQQNHKDAYGKGACSEWTCHPHSLRYTVLRHLFDDPIIYWLSKDQENVNIKEYVRKHYHRNRNKDDICIKHQKDRDTHWYIENNYSEMIYYLHGLNHKIHFQDDTEDGPFHWIGFYSLKDSDDLQSKDIWKDVIRIFLLTRHFDIDEAYKHNGYALYQEDKELFGPGFRNEDINGFYLLSPNKEKQGTSLKSYIGALMKYDFEEADERFKELLKTDELPGTKFKQAMNHEFIMAQENKQKILKHYIQYLLTCLRNKSGLHVEDEKGA